MARGCSLRLARAALARKERRRRLIERINEKEKLIGPHGPTQGGQMSEEVLPAEIEKQRTLNAARRGFRF